jgi:hypothetical protein
VARVRAVRVPLVRAPVGRVARPMPFRAGRRRPSVVRARGSKAAVTATHAGPLPEPATRACPVRNRSKTTTRLSTSVSTTPIAAERVGVTLTAGLARAGLRGFASRAAWTTRSATRASFACAASPSAAACRPIARRAATAPAVSIALRSLRRRDASPRSSLVRRRATLAAATVTAQAPVRTRRFVSPRTASEPVRSPSARPRRHGRRISAATARRECRIFSTSPQAWRIRCEIAYPPW